MSEIALRTDILATLEENGWISSTALVIDRELPYEKAESLTVLIGRVGSAARFWAGDILVYAERLYGERAAQLSEALNFSEHSRQDAVRVSLAIPPSRRRPTLSWWHHRLVAASWISPADRDRLLDRAEGEQLTTRELETLVRDLRALGSEPRGATGETDCDVVLDCAVQAFNEAVVSCYGPDATFEVVVRPVPGAELILRPGGAK
jgi:hypothetical protein